MSSDHVLLTFLNQTASNINVMREIDTETGVGTKLIWRVTAGAAALSDHATEDLEVLISVEMQFGICCVIECC